MSYSLRDLLGQTDQYIRGAAIINRMDELRGIHNWSEEEYATASSLLSETVSIALHDRGMQTYIIHADRTLIICLGQGSLASMENY
jgi:acyl-CoA oxidase